jgi:hypothetical protein
MGAELEPIQCVRPPMTPPAIARIDLDDRSDQPTGAVRHILWLARHGSSTHSRSRPS